MQNNPEEKQQNLEVNQEESVEKENINKCNCEGSACCNEKVETENNEESKASSEKVEEENDMLKFKNLKEENVKLKEELDSTKDKLLRTIAEYDNYRKRTQKEKENIYADSCEDILKELLPVLDNLERAVSVEGSAEDLKKGIEITIKQFNSSLEKLGVEEIQAEGDFDPNFHNAVMHIEDEKFGANQVCEVFQKGYKKGNKILRYSMVKVAN